MIKGVFFDLFFTLILPRYPADRKECDVLGMSVGEWERYAEEENLYRERALGMVKSESEILERITSQIPVHITPEQRAEVLSRRERRMRSAFLEVPELVLEVLNELRKSHIKIGLISNCDRIDIKFWDQSRLAGFFDDAVFSCEVGLLKPDEKIYRLALNRLGLRASECVFVGDGGSDELKGAKKAGMKTVFSEALLQKTKREQRELMASADVHIQQFDQLLRIVSHSVL